MKFLCLLENIYKNMCWGHPFSITKELLLGMTRSLYDVTQARALRRERRFRDRQALVVLSNSKFIIH